MAVSDPGRSLNVTTHQYLNHIITRVTALTDTRTCASEILCIENPLKGLDMSEDMCTELTFPRKVTLTLETRTPKGV